MAQRPEPLCRAPYTELALFRRLLVKQERELAEISKKADRRDRSRETLEARTETRKTRRAIENVLLKMGNKGREGRDRDGGAAALGSAARPPESPTPTPPPLPPKTPEIYWGRHHGGTLS